MERRYYKGEAYCSNCKKKVEIKVPEGTAVNEYLKENKKCPICKNKTLRSADLPPTWRETVR